MYEEFRGKEVICAFRDVKTQKNLAKVGKLKVPENETVVHLHFPGGGYRVIPYEHVLKIKEVEK